MKSKIFAAMLAASAVVALAPSAAQAAPNSSFSPTGGTFGNSATDLPSFSDEFLFNLGAGTYSISGTISSPSINSASQITFTGATLNGNPFTFAPIFSSGGTTFQFGFISNIGASSPNVLKISGFSTTPGAYSGSLTFTALPVPEPAAWALMVGGFGMMGVAMRSRRRKLAVAAA